LFGYRPSEVEQALAAQEAAFADCALALEARLSELDTARRRIRQLDAVCDQLSDRVIDRERELARVRLELERLREAEEDGMQVLAGLAEELDGVRRQARGQATRIRLRALRDAVELSERITELSRRPAEARERLLATLQEAIARIGADEDEQPEVERGPALRPVGDVFEGLIEVEVGPFGDFSQLVGFEDAAGGISATSQISVKRFARGRATLEMKLAEPVELLRELERRVPFGFSVRDQRSDRLVIDVDSVDAEAA
jgi:hypothetical protein